MVLTEVAEDGMKIIGPTQSKATNCNEELKDLQLALDDINSIGPNVI